jgi:hypothetical protein
MREMSSKLLTERYRKGSPVSLFIFFFKLWILSSTYKSRKNASVNSHVAVSFNFYKHSSGLVSSIPSLIHTFYFLTNVFFSPTNSFAARNLHCRYICLWAKWLMSRVIYCRLFEQQEIRNETNGRAVSAPQDTRARTSGAELMGAGLCTKMVQSPGSLWGEDKMD